MNKSKKPKLEIIDELIDKDFKLNWKRVKAPTLVRSYVDNCH